jgi:hypothetical protein
MSDMDFDEYKKEVLDPILESEEDIEKRSKLKDSLSQAFEETRSFYEKLPPYESPYTNLNFELLTNTESTKPNKSREYIREFMGLEFDVSKFHVNSYYNIKSELINFTNVKLCSVCYGELVFCVNDGGTVKNFTITPKIAGVNSIIFEEVN